MARPRTPVGTFGKITITQSESGQFRARARFRDHAGRHRQIEAAGSSAAHAERRLKKKVNEAMAEATGSAELTADSPFTHLVTAWLQSLDDSKRLAASTRYRYERDMRTLVLPAFESFDPLPVSRTVG